MYVAYIKVILVITFYYDLASKIHENALVKFIFVYKKYCDSNVGYLSTYCSFLELY